MIFRIALQEFRGRIPGFWIFVLCLSLGVMGIVTVGGVSDSMLSTLQRDGKLLLGGDASLRTRVYPISDEVKSWLEDNSDSLSVNLSLRTFVVREDRSERSLSNLRIIDDKYPLYGELKLVGGSELESGLDFDRGVLLAKELSIKLGVETGDKVWLGEKLFKVSGIIESEPDRDVRFDFFGPRVIIHRDAMEGTGLLMEGSLVRYLYRVRLENRDVSEFVSNLRVTFPESDWDLRTHDKADPNVEEGITVLYEFMTLIALTVMVIGGVGVGNATRSFLAGRLVSVAILKSVGATRRQVFFIYMVILMFMVLLGNALGTAVGGALPFIIFPLINDLLPISTDPLISWSSIMFGWGIGILIALVFVLMSLSIASKESVSRLFRHSDGIVECGGWGIADLYIKIISIFSLILLILLAFVVVERDEIVLYFFLGMVIVFVFFYVIAKVLTFTLSKLPETRYLLVNMAKSSLYRPGNMTAVVLMSLGLGLTVLVSIAMIQGGVVKTLREIENRDIPTFFLVDVLDQQREGVESLVSVYDQNAEVYFFPILRGRIISMGGKSVDDIDAPPEFSWVLEGDRALTWSDSPRFSEDNQLSQGEWWERGYEGEPIISFDEEAAEAFGLEVGDNIGVRVLGRNFSFRIDNLRRIKWESMGMNFLMMVPESVFRGAPVTYLSSVNLGGDRLGLFEEDLVLKMPNITPLRVENFVKQFRSIFSSLSISVEVLGLFAMITGLVVLVGVMLVNHEVRVEQATIYKVLGMTRGEFIFLSILEFGFLGVIAALGSSIIGVFFSYVVMMNIMLLDWHFSLWIPIYTTVIAVIITLSCGTVSTWFILKKPVGRLLRNE